MIDGQLRFDEVIGRLGRDLIERMMIVDGSNGDNHPAVSK